MFSRGIEKLAADRESGAHDEDFFFVELEPGDVLHVPARLRDTLHRSRPLNPGDCTCHPVGR
ncbi:hypothetical protein OIE52_22900 [Streptomyces canus]|uniref:hypothetical protein n=1 Tax=Streptomyces canus TaxID=58343 RepID=UPI00324F0E64